MLFIVGHIDSLIVPQITTIDRAAIPKSQQGCAALYNVVLLHC